jgi:hypothetical protein
MNNAVNIGRRVTAELPTATTLAKPLRNRLEAAVKQAREIAETAARGALEQLGVADAKAPTYLDVTQKKLRRRLRVHARAQGDTKRDDGSHEITHLVWEVAYEHWHRMLFARFLAESGLLMWEPGASVSLDDCRDIVDNHPEMALGAKSHWELAGKLAARMLPQVFKPLSPVYELLFAPELQRDLERLLASLSEDVFQASDSLGWVYQFWQAKRKEEVNASEVKIGADELPAVTQLFTEPYMVDFLLHNSLGAWWLTRHPDQACPVPLTYLRTLDDGTPAAGRFEGWPDQLSEFKLLDPCCGSGHFLVAAFLMLVPMRMAAEGLSANDAVDAVLADNLHGLEIDARCVEIAVFALALAAWRFQDEHGDPLGVRADMPAPSIACCGLKVAATSKDWEALVPDSQPHADLLRQELRLLHASFAQAPLLGSLLDPSKSLKADLATSSFATLKPLLDQALSIEVPANLWGESHELNDEVWDLALTAKGLMDAARLLDSRYHLVVTNVPYLARGNQSEALRVFSASHYPEAKNDLANVFLERCLELARDCAGVVQIVLPQNWLFLIGYKKQRQSLLKRAQWNLLARLGPGAFETITGEVVQAVLLTQTRTAPVDDFQLHGLDVSAPKAAAEKAELLRLGDLAAVRQKDQLKNADARIALDRSQDAEPLQAYAHGLVGIQTADDPHYVRNIWEFSSDRTGWELMLGSPENSSADFVGLSWLLKWDDGVGELSQQNNACIRGVDFIGRPGIAIHRMQRIEAYRYVGCYFHQNPAVIFPKDERHLSAIWCFCSSPEYNEAVRRIDQNLKVTNATLVKVPFDLAYWQQVATERYPHGLPEPYSDDPTQWLFHGHPRPATDPLQVAVARLLGYRWPAETNTSMDLSDEARTWIALCPGLNQHVDDDGIVCLAPVRGEKPAHERLLALLIAAWETAEPGSWRPATLGKLLADADYAGKSLELWLRDKFFEQHAKLFHHRPFIWHIWDGLKDGFSALVNYHKLDAPNLERLIHTYLGDWIRTQESGITNGIDGAEPRLVAAQALKRKLELILEGEKPYDIFVRWKPLADQPIGWNPDLNDGVRLNIRPFMTAEVLRHNKKPKLNISWDKDRGKDVATAPWFKLGLDYAGKEGDRINDHHLTLAQKQRAKDRK